MPNGDGLSESVKEFLRTYVSSVDQLEILLYLLRVAPQRITARALADALYLAPESVEGRLQTFTQKGLVERHTSGAAAEYCLSEREARSPAMDELARTYRERRVAVINFIFSNPITTIQSFADAFIIRKKPENE